MHESGFITEIHEFAFDERWSDDSINHGCILKISLRGANCIHIEKARLHSGHRREFYKHLKCIDIPINSEPIMFSV